MQRFSSTSIASFVKHLTALLGPPLTVHMQACGIARSTNVDYTVSVRLCAPCFKTKYVQKKATLSLSY